MPFGSVEIGGGLGSTDTKFAVGAFPFFDYLITPNFFAGVKVQYTFNLNVKDSNVDSSKELDLMIRLGGGLYVADKLQFYGYASPGYSIVMPPSGSNSSKPKGFAVGAHLGAMYDVTPTAFVNLELGYQFGLQKVSLFGSSVDYKVNLAQIGLGGGLRF